MQKESCGEETRVNINFFLLHLFRAYNYRVHRKMKQAKIMEGCEKRIVEQQQCSEKMKLISKNKRIFNSFIRWRSSEARKIMPKDPEQAVLVLLHIYSQFSKSPQYNYFLEKLFNPNIQNESQKIGPYLFELGKHKAKKDETKLKSTVQQMWQKFSSLRKACLSTNCSWTKFYRFTKLAKPKNRKVPYQRKLSQQQIDDIQTHMESEEVTFPLPDTEYAGKHFFKTSIGRAHKMYNVLPSCTCKISLSTYYKYRPKKFQLQGKIPFCQSCCEHCQTLKLL